MTRATALKLCRKALGLNRDDYKLRAHKGQDGRCSISVTRRPLKPWQRTDRVVVASALTWHDATSLIVKRAVALSREGRPEVRRIVT